MVTVLRHIIYDKHVLDIRLLSTDNKPVTGVPNGSTCIEIDTGKKYMFDGAGQQWKELAGSSIIINADGIYY